MNKMSVRLLDLCTHDGQLNVSIEELFSHLKEQSFGFLIILFSLPSALPIPAPGYSTPFGLVLLWFGLLLALGKTNPSLPKRWQKRSLKLSPKIVQHCVRALNLLERFIHPGRAHMFCKCLNRRILGINLSILAIIMALPIPLTNTLPAMVILLFGFGLLENDGLVLLIAQTLSCLLITTYIAIATWIIIFGVESLQHIFHS